MKHDLSRGGVVLYVMGKTSSGAIVCSVPSCQAWFHTSEEALHSFQSCFGSSLNIVWQDSDNPASRNIITDILDSPYASSARTYFNKFSTGIRPLEDASIFDNPVVSITSRCNLRCPYCYMSIPSLKGEQKHDIDSEKIRAFINTIYQLSDGRTRTIQFFGGEPTLHREFSGLVNYALDLGLYVRISTNGTAAKIRSQALFCCVKNGNVEWRISLDSHIPEKHDRFRGRGTFRSVMRNLSYLRDNGANVSIKTVITRDNIDDFPDYIRFGHENKFRVAYGVLGTVGDARKNALHPGITRLEIIETIIDLYRKHPELIAPLGPSPFGRMIRALYVRNTMPLPPFFFYMHHDEHVYPMDELTAKRFRIGAWDSIDVDSMHQMHRAFCLNNSACNSCGIEPFCYRGSFADTAEESKPLDQEFVTCKERRQIYFRLMSLGNEGNDIACILFQDLA